VPAQCAMRAARGLACGSIARQIASAQAYDSIVIHMATSSHALMRRRAS